MASFPIDPRYVATLRVWRDEAASCTHEIGSFSAKPARDGSSRTSTGRVLFVVTAVVMGIAVIAGIAVVIVGFFMPDFMPRQLAGPWRWVERAVEVTPGVNIFAAHNVVVARKT